MGRFFRPRVIDVRGSLPQSPARFTIMSSTKVYLCPSCQSVVRSEKETSDGLKCDECGFSFGAGGAAKKEAKKISVPTKSGSIVRDVMKQRSGSAPLVEFSSIELPTKKVAKSSDEDEKKLGSRDEESILPDGTRQVKRRKKRRKEESNKKLFLFITGWVSVIVGLVVLFKMHEESEKTLSLIHI